MLKLIRTKMGRGFYAPALPTLLKFPLRRFGRASRGHVLAGAGVAATTVTLVALLTWWNGVNMPASRPIGEAIDRVLPGVLQGVDDTVTTLLGGDEGTVRGAVLRSAREGVAAVTSAIPSPGGLREIVADRSTSVLSPASSAESPPKSSTVPPHPEAPPRARTSHPSQ